MRFACPNLTIAQLSLFVHAHCRVYCSRWPHRVSSGTHMAQHIQQPGNSANPERLTSNECEPRGNHVTQVSNPHANSHASDTDTTLQSSSSNSKKPQVDALMRWAFDVRALLLPLPIEPTPGHWIVVHLCTHALWRPMPPHSFGSVRGHNPTT